MDIERIKAEAEKQGYELAHGQESIGEHVFGLLIFVRMSQRKVCSADSPVLYRAADEIQEGLARVTAQTDPKAPMTRAVYRDEVVEIYARAGAGTIYIEELPNEYCKRACCLNRPWFRVTSALGHVVIGRRKRVFSIDWKDSRVALDGHVLFPDEDVTRWETGIHAWSVDKAVEYVRRLHDADRAQVR